jgi:hypothetical protein
LTGLLAATAAQASRDAGDIPVLLEDVSGQTLGVEGWIAVGALAADPGGWVEAAMDLGRRRVGAVDAKTLGAHLAGQLGRALSPLAAALGAGRVVDVSKGWVFPSVGVFDPYPALALPGCPVAVAAGDPAATRADAVLADLGALQERFCAGLVTPVLAPVLQAVHERSTFARRAGEALAVEVLLRSFATARRREAPERWQADTAALADRMGLAPRLVPTFVEVTSGPHTDLITVGGACCRYDRWPQGETCDFCTLKPVDERVALWHDELAEAQR